MRIRSRLEAVVAAALKRLRKSRPVNFRTRAVSLGQPKIESLDNIAEVIAAGEGEAYL